jgi:hypothetical protein
MSLLVCTQVSDVLKFTVEHDEQASSSSTDDYSKKVDRSLLNQPHIQALLQTQKKIRNAIPLKDQENLARFVCTLASVVSRPNHIFKNILPLCGNDERLLEAVAKAQRLVVFLEALSPTQCMMALMHGAETAEGENIPADVAHPDTYIESGLKGEALMLRARVLTNCLWQR